MKIVIELLGGKVAAVYGSEDNVEVSVFEDLTDLTDEQEDKMEALAAAVPFILYRGSTAEDVTAGKENRKVLTVVDEALRKYGTDVLSVDLNDVNGMIDVNICTRHWSDSYMSSVARFDMCDKKALEKELDKRNVGHCW